MVYAQVALDISTRALDCAFDYGVPEALESQAVVGATVLVSFGHRQAVGYIVSLSDRPSAKIRADHICPFNRCWLALLLTKWQLNLHFGLQKNTPVLYRKRFILFFPQAKACVCANEQPVL